MTIHVRSIRSISWRAITWRLALAGAACVGLVACKASYQDLRALPDASGAIDSRDVASSDSTSGADAKDAVVSDTLDANLMSMPDASVDAAIRTDGSGNGADVSVGTGGMGGTGGLSGTGGVGGAGGFGGGFICTPRDCTSAADNDCNGKPDNTVDTTCQCTVGRPQACDVHAGLDGHGPCKAGTQTCVASADKSSSAWGPCTGAVGPATADSCNTAGDDANCNDRPNEGCTCVNGTTQPCGPLNPKGICKAGTSTCVNAAWGACVGAVNPRPRDCTSSADNDCNGTPDNAETTFCGCAPGSNPRSCTTGLPGICASGTQTCDVSSDKTTAGWTACAGASPGSRDCRSTADNNCNGTPDKQESACGCPTANQPQSCSTGLPGVCAAGTQTCKFATDNASSGWSTCSGPIAGVRDCNSNADNNCNGIADNAESNYCKCNPSSAPRSCGSHPGYDGVGTCTAGTQKCVLAGDKASSDWGSCSGDVGPVTTEGCGPNEQDRNCDGIAGDGSSCTNSINIAQYLTNCSLDNTLHTENQATTDRYCSDGNCEVIGHFKVFSASKPQPTGTVALRNCQWQYSPAAVAISTFVKIGTDCSIMYPAAADLLEAWHITDLGVVGYLSTKPAAGYTRLLHSTLKNAWYSHESFENWSDTPLSSCPACVGTCEVSNYYVVP